MTHRKYDERALYGDFPGFERWKEDASAARERVCAAKPPRSAADFDSRVWGKLKKHLLRYFKNKCAYCEIAITAGQPGDIDHYRPKLGITEAPGHPGYYWLAYDPRNLLPTCRLCNQEKKNHFPVNGAHCQPGSDHSGEDPQLLNPYEDEPQKHLKYGSHKRNGQPTGYVLAMTASKKGKSSIDTYDLNRPTLSEERHRAQLFALDLFILATTKGQPDRFRKWIQPENADREPPFLAAIVGAIDNWKQWYREKLDREILVRDAKAGADMSIS